MPPLPHLPERDKRELFDLIGDRFAEGHQILDLLLHASEDPDVILTEAEKCNIYMLRFFFAAVTEAPNKAMERFSVDPRDISTLVPLLIGEAIASHAVQAFDLETPRARRLVRKAVKDLMMQGYDHFMNEIDRVNREGDTHG
jgi:hypothetical protein